MVLEPSAKPSSVPEDLAVLAVYFNPYGDITLKRNLSLFLDHMRNFSGSFFLVEVALGDRFQLEASSNVIQLSSNAVLWHKEAALNEAVKRLADKFTKVCWLDVGSLYLSSDWAARLSALLDSCNICQAFSSAIVRATDASNSYQVRTCRGALAGFLAGQMEDTIIGTAWAARRNFFEKVRLFDFSVTGENALVLLFATLYPKCHPWSWAMSALETPFFASMSPELLEECMTWINCFQQEQQLQPGMLQEKIDLLLGLRSRPIVSIRHSANALLKPRLDLKRNADGLLEWVDPDSMVAKRTKEFFLWRTDRI